VSERNFSLEPVARGSVKSGREVRCAIHRTAEKVWYSREEMAYEENQMFFNLSSLCDFHHLGQR